MAQDLDQPSISTSAQGRIITQNPDLLAYLRSQTMESDKPLRKVYVDPPVSGEEDDGYRFVSANVDDFDDEHVLALQTNGSARVYGEYHPIKPSRTQSELDSGRYVDNDSAYQSPKTKLPHHAVAGNAQKPQPTVIRPIKSPYRPEIQEEVRRNEEELRAEDSYQQQVRARIRHSENVLVQQESIQVCGDSLHFLPSEEQGSYGT